MPHLNILHVLPVRVFVCASGFRGLYNSRLLGYYYNIIYIIIIYIPLLTQESNAENDRTKKSKKNVTYVYFLTIGYKKFHF